MSLLSAPFFLSAPQRMNDTAASTLARPAPAETGVPVPAPQPEAKPILAVEQVTLAYGRNIVLRDVNLRIHQGDFWCLLGPNGEGKSTLLKALLGGLPRLNCTQPAVFTKAGALVRLKRDARAHARSRLRASVR